MKILFLYRYGILGGLCTQPFHRFRHLKKDAEIDIHCGFRSDHGVKEMLEPYATLHFGLNKETTIEFLKENEFDKIVVIDSEEYLDAINEANPTSTVIVEVHTSIERNLEYLSRIKENDVDKFVTVSKYMVGRVRHHLNFELNTEEILRFQNVLDSSIFSPFEINTSGPPVVVWVGKIDDHKDWKAFMNISSLIREEDESVEFWIVGGQTCPESRAAEVFDYAEEKGILSRFRWLDRIENVNMPLLYSLVSERGGVNLVTSHCESFGMSVLESLLTGCPVVSTNVGALPEITEQSKYYKLYNLGDYSSAAVQCVSSMKESGSIRDLLSNSRKDLVNMYDSELRSNEYWSLLETIGDSDV